jgi:hypothetical protein
MTNGETEGDAHVDLAPGVVAVHVDRKGRRLKAAHNFEIRLTLTAGMRPEGVDRHEPRPHAFLAIVNSNTTSMASVNRL